MPADSSAHAFQPPVPAPPASPSAPMPASPPPISSPGPQAVQTDVDWAAAEAAVAGQQQARGPSFFGAPEPSQAGPTIPELQAQQLPHRRSYYMDLGQQLRRQHDERYAVGRELRAALTAGTITAAGVSAYMVARGRRLDPTTVVLVGGLGAAAGYMLDRARLVQLGVPRVSGLPGEIVESLDGWAAADSRFADWRLYFDSVAAGFCDQPLLGGPGNRGVVSLKLGPVAWSASNSPTRFDDHRSG